MTQDSSEWKAVSHLKWNRHTIRPSCQLFYYRQYQFPVLAQVFHGERKMVGKGKTSAAPRCVFYHRRFLNKQYRFSHALHNLQNRDSNFGIRNCSACGFNRVCVFHNKRNGFWPGMRSNELAAAWRSVSRAGRGLSPTSYFSISVKVQGKSQVSLHTILYTEKKGSRRITGCHIIGFCLKKLKNYIFLWLIQGVEGLAKR